MGNDSATLSELSLADTLPVERSYTPPILRAPKKSTPSYSGSFANILANVQKQMELQQTGTQNGLSVHQQVDSLKGVVYTCVKRICDGVAQVPLRVYQSSNDGSKPKPIDDPRHPLVNVLTNPNPHDTRSDLWASTITNLLLTGNAYWLKVYDNPDSPRRVLKELWSLPSQWVQAVTTGYNGLSHYRWIYQGNDSPIPPGFICHFRNYNPNDRFVGLSVLACAAAAVKSDSAIKASQLASLDNEVQSSLFLTTDKVLTEDEYSRALMGFMSRFGGYQNAGVPPILHGGLKPEFARRPNAEMAYPESSALARNEILGIFGVPPLFAGVIESANNSNTASQDRVFHKLTIWPLCVGVHERINKDLAWEYGPTTTVEFDNPVKGDELVDSRIRDTAVKNGTLTINEAREQMGLPPIEQVEPPKSDESAKTEPVAEPKADEKPADTNTASDPDNDPKQNKSVVRVGPSPSQSESLGRRHPLPDQRQHGSDTTAVRGPTHDERYQRGSPAHSRYRSVLVRSVESDYAKLNAAFVKAGRTFFIAQAKRIKEAVKALAESGRGLTFIDQTATVNLLQRGDEFYRLHADGTVTEELGSQHGVRSGKSVDFGCLHGAAVESYEVNTRATVEELLAWEAEADRLLAAYMPHVKEAVKTGGESQFAQLDMSDAFDINSPEAEDWLRKKEHGHWAKDINKTTRDRLNEELSVVMNEGFNLEKAEAAIEKVMGDRIKSDTRTIAISETTSAYNAGSNIVRDQVGVREKEWLATFDELTRPAHEDADAQVVDQRGAFDVGGEELKFPGDPAGSPWNVINCRCVAVAAFSDEPLRPVDADDQTIN
jgi:HK97 family phage portal protein